MNRRGVLRWLLPAVGLVAVAGGVTMATASGDLRIAGQVVFAAAALVLLGAALAGLLRRPNAAMEGYKCPTCSYVPKVHDLKTAEPYPCPRCGQPIYKKP